MGPGYGQQLAYYHRHHCKLVITSFISLSLTLPLLLPLSSLLPLHPASFSFSLPSYIYFRLSMTQNLDLNNLWASYSGPYGWNDADNVLSSSSLSLFSFFFLFLLFFLLPSPFSPPSLLHCPRSSFVYILIVLSWKSAILVYRMWSLRYLFFLYFFFLFLFLSLFFFAFIILFLFCSSSSSYLPDFLLLFLITSFSGSLCNVGAYQIAADAWHGHVEHLKGRISLFFSLFFSFPLLSFLPFYK